MSIKTRTSGIMVNINVEPATAPVTATKWNSADKAAEITLTNNDLTADNPATASYRGVRAIASTSSGKKYWEVHVDDGSVGESMMHGIANGTFNLGNGTFLGQDSNGCGWDNTGAVFLNTGPLATIQTFTDGDTCCIAVDFDALKIWFRTNGGNWNNDVIANQNPATGAGGLSLATLAAGPYFAATTLNINATLTANFGGTGYAQTAPAGFGNW